MGASGISRKKLLQEPDEFQSLSQRTWVWVHAHRERALAIVGAIVGAVLLVVAVKAFVEHSHRQRADTLAGAIARYTQAKDGALPQGVKEELAGFAEKNSGTTEGAVARYFQAGALAAGGDWQQARQIFVTLAAPGGKNPDVAASARVALAYLELAHGSADGARSAFEELLKSTDAVPRAQIMLELAAIHQKQGRAAEARRLYQALVDEHPDGSWAATAKERLQSLAGQGPAAS